MQENDPQFRAENAAALVATSSERLPDASLILAACGFGAGPFGAFFRRVLPQARDHDWEDGNLVIPFRGGQLIVFLVPAPIPWSDLEGPCATAWWWPEATQRMREHKCHIWVVLKGGAIEPVERRVILTRVVRSVIEGTDAVGVYWAEGTLVHEPMAFLRQAKSATLNTVPGVLWIDVRVEENGDGSLRCFTTGMVPLGSLEIEVRSSTLPHDQLMEFIGDTACYIVNGRVDVSPGQTMGRSAAEQYKVRHSPSMFDRGTVMELVME